MASSNEPTDPRYRISNEYRRKLEAGAEKLREWLGYTSLQTTLDHYIHCEDFAAKLRGRE